MVALPMQFGHFLVNLNQMVQFTVFVLFLALLLLLYVGNALDQVLSLILHPLSYSLLFTLEFFLHLSLFDPLFLGPGKLILSFPGLDYFLSTDLQSIIVERVVMLRVKSSHLLFLGQGYPPLVVVEGLRPVLH